MKSKLRLVVLLLAVSFLCLGNSGCCGDHEPEKVEGKKVERGDILYSKLSGEKVQVISIWGDSIECRVVSGRKTRDGLVSKDSFVQEYAEVYFKPFELTWEKPEPER